MIQIIRTPAKFVKRASQISTTTRHISKQFMAKYKKALSVTFVVTVFQTFPIWQGIRRTSILTKIKNLNVICATVLLEEKTHCLDMKEQFMVTDDQRHLFLVLTKKTTLSSAPNANMLLRTKTH